MADPNKWGKKYTCFKCDCKFYDLNRPKAICPKCKADQADRVDEEEEFVEEEVEEEDKVVATDEEVELHDEPAATGGEDDLPEMEEDLGYDENTGGEEEE
jgi:hypothetical protein